MKEVLDIEMQRSKQIKESYEELTSSYKMLCIDGPVFNYPIITILRFFFKDYNQEG